MTIFNCTVGKKNFGFAAEVESDDEFADYDDTLDEEDNMTEENIDIDSDFNEEGENE